MKTFDRHERDHVLERQRERKMARSAHAYVRGNTARFYEWLDGLGSGCLPEGPPVWICGDCHLGNLGPLADADGQVDVQVRDLDQTVIGNPAHDLVRLGLSLASAARGSDLPGVVTARMLEEMMRGYVSGLAGNASGREPDAVRTVRVRALGRRWKHLARERIKDVEPSIPLGRKFWALDAAERGALDGAFENPEVRRLVLSLNGRYDEAEIRLVDAAYWMKGCSSLGNLRYAGLVRITDADGHRSFALVDFKEAVDALAPTHADASMPTDPARRVVCGARAMSPNLGDRMLPIRLLDRSVVMRELCPQDLKLDVDQFSKTEAVRAAGYLAHVVGRAHGRQMDQATASEWEAEVTRMRDGDEAPRWLWSSVVHLAGLHETGYLEHCRVHALRDAA
ncbi:DUF2252 family protein [Methylobacterium sp. J-088]|uniref:DUF2252 family protein n=1 Tax=Methylobacterium sp. J-088 TaxID=2836664 RepID=UPI0028C39740|nr:DUF2252 family protein [Methylobacterium sp. J-088]